MRLTWKAAALLLAPTLSSAYVIADPESLDSASGNGIEASPDLELRM